MSRKRERKNKERNRRKKRRRQLEHDKRKCHAVTTYVPQHQEAERNPLVHCGIFLFPCTM
jgi:hypothetical protein